MSKKNNNPVKNYAFGITVYYHQHIYCRWYEYQTNHPTLVSRILRNYIESMKADTDEYIYQVRVRKAKTITEPLIKVKTVEEILEHWQVGAYVKEERLVQEEVPMLVGYLISNKDWEWEISGHSSSNTFFSPYINNWLLTFLKEHFTVLTACNGCYYVREHISVYKEYDESLNEYAYSIVKNVTQLKRVVEESYKIFK